MGLMCEVTCSTLRAYVSIRQHMSAYVCEATRATLRMRKQMLDSGDRNTT
jgi:hypothetical protein